MSSNGGKQFCCSYFIFGCIVHRSEFVTLCFMLIVTCIALCAWFITLECDDEHV